MPKAAVIVKAHISTMSRCGALSAFPGCTEKISSEQGLNALTKVFEKLLDHRKQKNTNRRFLGTALPFLWYPVTILNTRSEYK